MQNKKTLPPHGEIIVKMVWDIKADSKATAQKLARLLAKSTPHSSVIIRVRKRILDNRGNSR